MIRRAKKTDADDIRILMEQLEGHSFDADNFREFFKKALKTDGYDMWVYESDGMVMAVITLLIKMPVHHAAYTSEVMELVVHEDCRSRGIGSKLLEHAEKLAHERGITEIEINSKKIRKDAHRFYHAHGYENLRNNLTKEFR